jgi:transcriptional regulator with XRE-family HTH domain
VSPSPVVANWELVVRIRERRVRLGTSVNDLTAQLGFTRNYWSAIENEHKIIPEKTLKIIFRLLEFDSDERQQLLKLRDEATKNGWWSEYSALFDNKIQRLLGLEHGAKQIRAYDTLLIPGLLQTADYAQAIMESDATVRPVEVEQRVVARMRRQELLRGDNPLHLTAIMSEAALLQQVGGVDVLRGQLGHLLTMSEQYPTSIEIRLIPFTADACSLLGAGTLSLLDFPSPRLPRVAWHEAVTIWGVITDTNQVRDIAIGFSEALMRTLDREATLKTIAEHRRNLR